jgi:hypothetical protein
MLETDNSLTSAISAASRFRAQAPGGSDFGSCVGVRPPRECRVCKDGEQLRVSGGAFDMWMKAQSRMSNSFHQRYSHRRIA